jgi:hypothetical protein
VIHNGFEAISPQAKGWSREFDEPIPLPNGRKLVTLKDAGTYITKLPKAEHMAPEWQAAMQALILVARGGPTMLARIGVMRALHRHDFLHPARNRIGDKASWRATANLFASRAGSGRSRPLQRRSTAATAQTS